MFQLRKTPLAWKNLTHDWRRLCVAVAGIGFAVLLMFMQVGFQKALFDSQVKIIDDLEGDIFLVSRARYTLASEKRFPIEMLARAQACVGVEAAYPLYTELTLSRLKDLQPGATGKGYPIRSLGCLLNERTFKSKRINDQFAELRLPHTALIDLRSKRENFNFPLDDQETLADVPLELANKRIRLVGTFDMGTDFAHDGNLIMSQENFARYYPQRNRFGDPLAVVDIGIIRLDEGAALGEVRRTIDAVLDDQVRVLTRAQFRAGEIKFWDDSTPIGIIFAAGKVIGFIVGMVICYQVIYSDIADHMAEFATLRAMGYTSGYFVRLIVTEAVLLSLIGFVPGIIVSWGLYTQMASATGLLLMMTKESVVGVLLLTLTMCILSGILAVRKLLSADPASLF